MGIRRTLNEVASAIGDGSFDTLDFLAEQSRQLMCGVYRNHPDRLYLDGTIVGEFQDAFMDRMCNDAPPPPAPTVQFTGGQCPCVAYDVTVERPFPGGSPPPAPDNTKRVLGRVKGLRHVFSPQGSPGTQNVRSFVDFFQCVGGVETGVILSVDMGTSSGITIPENFHDEWFIKDIVRVDGQPDNCGDPPESYPPTGVAPDYNQVTTNVTLNDNRQITYNFEWVNEPGNFPYVIDVNGIEINIDLGGFNFNQTPGTPSNNGGTLPSGEKSPLPQDGDDINKTLPPPVVKPPNEQDYEVEEQDETAGEEKEVDETLEFVRINVVNKPANADEQFGNGAPNIVYAGWFEFQSSGYNFKRIPIHFTQSIFRRPEGATGYAFTMKTGFTAVATEYKKKLD